MLGKTLYRGHFQEKIQGTKPNPTNSKPLDFSPKYGNSFFYTPLTGFYARAKGLSKVDEPQFTSRPSRRQLTRRLRRQYPIPT